MTMLSLHFSLAELTVSETAARHGIDNTPSPEITVNLRRLARTLEAVRELMGAPIHITSGYRSPALNKEVGGSTGSAHMQGLAADFIVPPHSPVEACRIIAASEIGFDQLINEFTWVHLGLVEGEGRRQVLTLSNGRLVDGLIG